jgi:hypothetical protein
LSMASSGWFADLIGQFDPVRTSARGPVFQHRR